MVSGQQHGVFHPHKLTQDSDFLLRTTTSTTAMAAVAAAGVSLCTMSLTHGILCGAPKNRHLLAKVVRYVEV